MSQISAAIFGLVGCAFNPGNKCRFSGLTQGYSCCKQSKIKLLSRFQLRQHIMIHKDKKILLALRSPGVVLFSDYLTLSLNLRSGVSPV